MSALPVQLNACMDDKPAGNSEWFRTVVGKYEGALVRYAARMTRDLEQARDVVQDAFLRLHSLNGDRPTNVQAWLYTVCRRRALDLLRKENRMKTLPDGHAAVCECPMPSQSAVMEQAETENRLLALVNQLPENQQEVVRLKFQDDLSYRDIAEVTGLSVSNVGFLLHVAVKALRERMIVSE